MQAKITKRAVDTIKATDRDLIVWDTELRGFGLRCRVGGSKFYVVKYRAGDQQRWWTLGRHGPLTPDEARREATKLLGDVAKGIDPAEAREQSREDLTVTELCDLYVAQGCAAKKPSTLATDRGRIERHIKPLLGRKKLRAVTRGDVERLMADVAAGKTATDEKTGFRGRAIVRGGKGTASKAVALLGAIFTFAVNRGLRPDNPAHGIKTFKPRKHERFLSPDELERLGDALAAAEREGGIPCAVAAIRLLTLTGCRKSEILTLRWSHVDFDRACLRLSDSKTGEKVVPLSKPALELLSSLPRLEGNPYVLPGNKAGGHYVGLPKVWRQIRERARLSGVRLHDLRHTYASVAVGAGLSLPIIGKLLGHTQAVTTARYAHLADDPLWKASDLIGEKIAAAMKGQAADAEVVDMPKRRV